MNLKDFIGNATHIMVAFDRSGSFIEDSDIAIRRLYALRNALTGFTGTVQVVAFDHKVMAVNTITRADQVMGIKFPHMGGGSSLKAVEEIARGANVEKLVIFTDGYLSDGRGLKIPTLFVLDEPTVHGTPVRMPYGSVIGLT